MGLEWERYTAAFIRVGGVNRLRGSYTAASKYKMRQQLQGVNRLRESERSGRYTAATRFINET